MKKLLILVAAAAALAISPYFVGSKSEAHIKKILELTNENPSINITIIDYKKGWFSTTATFEMELTMQLDPDMKNFPRLRFIEEMKHGPLLWQTEGIGLGLIDTVSTIVLPEEWQAEINKIEAINEETLQMTSRTDFDGTTRSHFNLKAIHHISEDNNSIIIKPATATFTYNMSGHMFGSFLWQGLQFSEQGKRILKTGKLEAEFDSKVISGNMFSGNAISSGTFDAVIENITFTGATPAEAVELSNFRIKGESDVHQELIDVHLLYEVEKIAVMAQKFNELQFDTSILNLDIEALQDLNELIVQSQQQLQQDPQAQSSALLANMQSVVPKLLTKDPQLKINNFGLNTDHGKITSQLNMRINPELFSQDNPQTFVAAIELDASGSGPEAFFNAQGLATMIEPLVEQKMLIREDGQLKFNLTFIQGVPLINGNPMPNQMK
ncbi:MAG: YdgA family protein [Gammaproteobacteria bacterium]|nr:YdgA family protein [Gammaproteobacteria bacterium]